MSRRRILIVLLNSYSLALMLYLVLRLVIEPRWWWLIILNTGTVFLFLPLVVIIGIGIALRSSITSGVAILLLLWGINQFVAIPLRPIEPAQTPVRVLTYNISSLPRNQTIDRLHAWVLGQQADIIAFQEVQRWSTWSAVYQHLLDIYPYHIYVNNDNNVQLLSRYPIIEHEASYLYCDNNYANLVTRKKRSLVYAEVLIDERPVSIYAVHLESIHSAGENPLQKPVNILLNLDVSQRNCELEYVLARIANDPNPVILAGDLNLSHTDPSISRLRDAGLKDAFAEAGFGFGFTGKSIASVGLVRVDYIWHSDHFRTADVYVGDNGDSDHFAVVATLDFMPD